MTDRWVVTCVLRHSSGASSVWTVRFANEADADSYADQVDERMGGGEWYAAALIYGPIGEEAS